MSLVPRCDDCQELESRCVCGLTLEEAKAKRLKPIIPSHEAQVRHFVRRGHTGRP